MNIWWIRRDLRLYDNQALSAALKGEGEVVPVFILDEKLLSLPAFPRQAFLFHGLQELDEDLRSRGSRLILRRGDPAAELAILAQECGTHQVFAEEDITPYARSRDTGVAGILDLHLTGGLGVHPASVVTKPDGNPYTIFTPFSRAWKWLPVSGQTLPAPKTLPAVPDISSVSLPQFSQSINFPSGEREAQRRLAAFLDGTIFEYQSARDRLDLNGTSSLSPYLHFGMFSVRQAVTAARQAAVSEPDARSRASCEVWINELIWREFYQSILYHFPYVLRTAFKPSMRSIPWRNAPEELNAWQEGFTGYPVVDAGMRQLAATGWMHNRARMITASFLVKHLLIDWQQGERWFMRNLVDGDPASNNGGWQWTAGTGTDAAPYFRIFNPILQGKKFDPDGNYIRQWVPELALVPGKHIHTPWEMSLQEQHSCEVIIGSDYPAPIVDHKFARKRVLAAYSKA